MIHFIKEIKSVTDYSVVCLFNTGELKEINLTSVVEKYHKLNDGWVSELYDKEFFKRVKLDSYGTLCWENEVDFDPEVLYENSKSVS